MVSNKTTNEAAKEPTTIKARLFLEGTFIFYPLNKVNISLPHPTGSPGTSTVAAVLEDDCKYFLLTWLLPNHLGVHLSAAL